MDFTSSLFGYLLMVCGALVFFLCALLVALCFSLCVLSALLSLKQACQMSLFCYVFMYVGCVIVLLV